MMTFCDLHRKTPHLRAKNQSTDMERSKKGVYRNKGFSIYLIYIITLK